jgi:hypothetical protein
VAACTSIMTCYLEQGWLCWYLSVAAHFGRVGTYNRCSLG